MQPCVTRMRHSSASRISTAVPQLVNHNPSNGHVQQTPAVRIQPPISPATSPVRMSNRLSWRRRRDASNSSQPSAPGPEQYYNDTGFAPLHRSLSEVSPVSPLSERSPIIDADSRRLSRMGFVRRPSSQETAFVSPTQEYIGFTGPFPDAAPTTSRSTSRGLVAFPERSSSRFNIPFLQTSSSSGSSRGTQSSNQSSANPLDPGLIQPDRVSSFDVWGTTTTVTSAQRFMTSPTSYAESSTSTFTPSGRPNMAPRMSRPPGSMYQTFPPVGTPITPMTRIQNEEMDEEEFTSPTDFALFAEATSSLDITPLPSPNPATTTFPNYNQYAASPNLGPFPGPSPSMYAHHQSALSQQRLAAPLPPLPHQRSSSAPNMARRQPSRTQMLAEAITGLTVEDTRMGSSDEDDELPNYEQSQAEVAARKRREAAARARELEENWSRARRRGL